jgi:hypothetical protein
MNFKNANRLRPLETSTNSIGGSALIGSNFNPGCFVSP